MDQVCKFLGLAPSAAHRVVEVCFQCNAHFLVLLAQHQMPSLDGNVPVLSEMEPQTLIWKVRLPLRALTYRNVPSVRHSRHRDNRAALCVTLLSSLELLPNSTEAQLCLSLFLKGSHANVLCNKVICSQIKQNFNNLRESARASQLPANKQQRCRTLEQQCKGSPNCLSLGSSRTKAQLIVRRTSSAGEGFG